MFEVIEPHFDIMHTSASKIVATLEKNPLADYDLLKKDIDNVVTNEAPFLKGMDGIVFQYDDDAHDKVAWLRQLEYILLLISLVVIVLEIMFVFKPTTLHVNKTINQLVASEHNARQLTKEIGALYGSLEKSYEQLSQVNQPAENPKLFAKTDRGGNVIFISELFSELSGIEEVSPLMRLIDIFNKSNLNDDWMDDIVDRVSDGMTWQGEISFKDKTAADLYADVTIIPIYGEGEELEEWLILGSDITRQKFAEKNMRQKNRAEIDKKITSRSPPGSDRTRSSPASGPPAGSCRLP
jgi:PAS domain-containing protein